MAHAAGFQGVGEDVLEQFLLEGAKWEGWRRGRVVGRREAAAPFSSLKLIQSPQLDIYHHFPGCGNRGVPHRQEGSQCTLE